MARKRKVPDVLVDCAACGQEIEIRDLLRLGDSHADMCRARPVLLRVDSDKHGNWLPIIQSPDQLTDIDKSRIRDEIQEMIADFQRAGK